MKKRKFMAVLLAAALCVLGGCSNAKEETGGSDAPEEYQFVSEHVGKSLEEVKKLIDGDWEDRSEPDSDIKQYQDADGNFYIFYGDRLRAVRYAYDDAEKGFQACRANYEYINETFGDEILDHVMPDQKTLKDIQSLDAFKEYGDEESKYDVASNWYFAEDPSQWEYADPKLEEVWETYDNQPVLILDMWMIDDELSLAVGYVGLPKE